MTDKMDPTKQTREPFADPVTGDQSLPDQPPGRQPGADLTAAGRGRSGGGSTTGLPGELFAEARPRP